MPVAQGFAEFGTQGLRFAILRKLWVAVPEKPSVSRYLRGLQP